MLTTRKRSAGAAAPGPAGSRAGESARQLQSSPGIRAGGCSRTGAGTGPPSPIALPPLKSSSAVHTWPRKIDSGMNICSWGASVFDTLVLSE
uniref:Uncharacterized protein n=1 Tax=Sphaerodactylus townsendi TaxID=933632 RepID=A0ACB8FQN6_9SAUR